MAEDFDGRGTHGEEVTACEGGGGALQDADVGVAGGGSLRWSSRAVVRPATPEPTMRMEKGEEEAGLDILGA